MGVYRFTSEYEERGSISFHMPGHKGSDLYRRYGYDYFLKDFPDRDITEIAGADNLFQPEGIIADTMEKYRRLYDARASYLLINGSSAGLIAAIMSCAGSGEKIIMARNCHKSVFNALRLGDIEPVYVYPEMVSGYGIAGQVRPEAIAFAIKENPDARAIILPSTNYYGICSKIGEIAELAREAGMLLIVDQAHGAHLKFFETAHRVLEKDILSGMNIDVSEATGSASVSEDKRLEIPISAESSGADIVINSTHKTLASLTQSAILNVCSDKVDLFDLEDKLQMIQSTSPSYILMESLDINADIMSEHGDQLITEWYDDLVEFYHEAMKIPGLEVMRTEGLDPSKINLDMSGIGLDGEALNRELMERDIFPELSAGNILMCMSGVGNRSEDYNELLKALKDLSVSRGARMIADEDILDEDAMIWREGMEGFEDKGADEGAEDDDPYALHDAEDLVSGKTECADPLEEAGLWTRRREIRRISGESELVTLEEAAGRVCTTALIPYPPGIPLVCPGEIISGEDIEFIRGLRERGEKVIGVDPEGRVSVGTGL